MENLLVTLKISATVKAHFRKLKRNLQFTLDKDLSDDAVLEHLIEYYNKHSAE